MTERLIVCKKLGKELPGLRFRPLPSPLGRMIYDQISAEAWQMWLRESPRYINTYRLDLQTAEGRDFLEKQMRVFFGFEDGALPETAWRPPEE